MSTQSSTGSVKLSAAQHGMYMQGQKMTSIVREWMLSNASCQVKQQNNLLPQQQTNHLATTSRGGCRARGGHKSTQLRKNNHQAPKATPSTSITVNLRPTQYLPVAADIISNAAAKEVPRYIVRALRNQIKFRKIVCSFFAGEKEDRDVIESNEKHQFFIQVLRRVLLLLLPHQQTLALTKKTQANATETKVQADTEAIDNMYEALLSPGCDSTELDSELELMQLQDSASDPLSPEEVADQAEDPLVSENAPRSKRSEYRQRCRTRCLLYDVERIMAFIHRKW